MSVDIRIVLVHSSVDMHLPFVFFFCKYTRTKSITVLTVFLALVRIRTYITKVNGTRFAVLDNRSQFSTSFGFT